MIENTFADEILHKIDKEDSATFVVNALFSVIFQINIYIKKIRELDKTNSLSQRYCGDEKACHSYRQSKERFLGHSRTLGVLFLGRTDSVELREKSLHFRYRKYPNGF
jgi:hypothetical protein